MTLDATLVASPRAIKRFHLDSTEIQQNFHAFCVALFVI